MQRFFVAWLLVLSGVVVVGCSSSSDDDKPKGRGDDACHQWQSAVCAWGTRCGASATVVSTCKEQAPGVTCKSDDLATSCAASLKSNACTTAPTGCDLRDLADPAPAVTACGQYLDAVCTSIERCGESTKAECLADPQFADLCTGVIGYKPSFEQCLGQLKTIACTASSLPEICNGVVLK